jgi:hypothetical protein
MTVSIAAGRRPAKIHEKTPKKVAAFTLAACVIAAIAAWTARETYRTDMHDLGRAG